MPLPNIRTPLLRTGQDTSSSSSSLSMFQAYLGIDSWISVLLVFVPLSLLSRSLDWDVALRFWFSLLAIPPLATVLDRSVRELSKNLSSTSGGLLEALAANEVNLFIGILALMQDQALRVQGFIVGSILVSTPLALGSAFFTGSNIESSKTSASGLRFMSHGTAIILLITYLGYQAIQLKARSTLSMNEPRQSQSPRTTILAATLGAVVASVEEATARENIPQVFVSVILLPIVSNTAKYLNAVSAAHRGSITTSIGSCIDSVIQLATFVAPVLVITGWIASRELPLFFSAFQNTHCGFRLLMLYGIIATARAYSLGCLGDKSCSTSALPPVWKS
ncbi:hypothetical protein IEO21_06708 [Rhodonia placenta]|uniref:Sodium/calcium exchanger membrane region domain-containing protein n=1 Tax=Rhodonia placenta TaxID=104341 RepID=A0A8H7U118_9APHY|nr:hypothetical protein IEO21_06708 [Postia placenta]